MNSSSARCPKCIMKLLASRRSDLVTPSKSPYWLTNLTFFLLVLAWIMRVEVKMMYLLLVKNSMAFYWSYVLNSTGSWFRIVLNSGIFLTF